MDFLTSADGCGAAIYTESTTSFRLGAYYVVPVGATGTWAGHANYLASYSTFLQNWKFSLPNTGQVVYDEGLGHYRIWTGSAWTDYEYAVKFTNFQCENDLPVLDGMAAMRIAGTYAGIHSSGGKYLLESDYSQTYDPDDYVLTADGTWSHSSEKLHGVGTGSGSHYGVCYHDQQVRLPMTINFVPKTSTGALAWGPETPLGSCYSSVLRWDATTIQVRTAVSDNEYDGQVKVADLKHGVLTDKHVRVTVRVQRASKLRTPGINPDSSWMMVDVFADGLHEFSCVYGYYPYSNPYVGFAVAAGETSEYDDLKIYELGQPIDVMSLDPNEAVAACLTRAIQQSYVNVFSRFDGSIYGSLATVSGDSVWTLQGDNSYSRQLSINGQAANSLRLTGAWSDAEDTTPNPSLGGIRFFDRPDDPNLVGEASEYAHRLADEIKRNLNGRVATQIAMSPPCYALEQQDVITYVSGLTGIWGTALNKWIVRAINLGIAKGGQAPKPVMEIQAVALEDPYEPS